MIHQNAIEAFEKSLTNMVSSDANNVGDQIFGGKIFVLYGDFMQSLPVVPKGKREMIVRSAINQSQL